MKNRRGTEGAQGGFILRLMLVVVGICVAFIVLSTLARALDSTLSGISSGDGPLLPKQAVPQSAYTEVSGTNPLLKFLDNTSDASYNSSGGSDVPASMRSVYSGSVNLGAGNGPSTAQPFHEYVTIQNSGGNSINITGWTLTNGKGTRPIQTSQNNYIYPVVDSAVIGQGTEFLDPSGYFANGPIVLKPGDNAIVTTGRPFTQFPFSISTSFRENICVGYLKNYPFQPALSNSCPLPANDSAIRTVTSECYDYMTSLSRCEDPYKYDKAGYDMQTAQCRAFMDARLSYPSCVANNKAKAGFYSKQWRIFLGKNAQLWSDRRETITLYDTRGLIVDQISY